MKISLVSVCREIDIILLEYKILMILNSFHILDKDRDSKVLDRYELDCVIIKKEIYPLNWYFIDFYLSLLELKEIEERDKHKKL